LFFGSVQGWCWFVCFVVSKYTEEKEKEKEKDGKKEKKRGSLLVVRNEKY